MKPLLYILFPALLLSGCADLFANRDAVTKAEMETSAITKMMQTSFDAADVLIQQAEARTVDRQGLDKNQTMFVGTVVDIDSLDDSSLIGRMVSEHISGQFSRRGYKMIEVKFRNHLLLRKDVGELMLTREIKELALEHKVQAVIVGTYTKWKGKNTIINLRLVRPSDNIVLASYEYVLPANYKAIAN